MQLNRIVWMVPLLLALFMFGATDARANRPVSSSAIAKQISEKRGQFETARTNVTERKKQLEDALATVEKAKSNYEKSLTIANEQKKVAVAARNEARQDLDRAKRVLTEAQAALRSAQAASPPDDAKIREATSLVRRYEADVNGFTESLARWTKDASQSVITVELVAAQKKIDDALSQKYFVSTLLNDAESELATAFNDYTSILLQNPPPFLKEIRVSSHRGLLYHARWDAEAGSGLSSRHRLRLINERSKIRTALGQLDSELKTNSDHRLSLAKSMHSKSLELIRQAENLAFNEQAKEVTNGVISFVSSAIDVVVAGGTATASEELLKRAVAATAASQAPKLGKLAVVKIADGAGVFAKPDPKSPLQSSAPDGRLEGIVKTGLGDALEFSAGTAIGDADDFIRVWDGFRDNGWQGEKLSELGGGKGSKFKEALKAGAPKALVELGVKLVVNQYFDGQIDVARRAYLRLLIETQADAEIINRSLILDRAKIDQRRALRVALEDLEYRLKLGSNRLTKNILKNEPLVEEDYKGGSVEALLIFNQSLSRPPVVKMGDLILESMKRETAGGDRWTAFTKRTIGAPQDISEMTVFVGAGSGNEPFSELDGKPATLAEFDYKTVQWAKSESSVDVNHKVQYQDSEFDLTGFWEKDTGELIYITQRGLQVDAVHERRSTKFPFEVGDPSFSAGLRGNILTGQLITRLSRPDYRKCPGDLVVPLKLTVSSDGNQLTGSWGRKTVSFPSCRVQNMTQAKRAYKRVLDKNGKPLRKPETF